jgi:hypothetical protein
MILRGGKVEAGQKPNQQMTEEEMDRWIPDVSERLTKGKSKQEVIDYLLSQGWQDKYARDLVEVTYASVQSVKKMLANK